MSDGFNVNYNAGGVVDVVKKIGAITGFPQFTEPFNEMIAFEIPAMKGDFDIFHETPDEELELMLITVSCTGYSHTDKYDLYCNDKLWFKNWYLAEVKEGLFLGPSTYVYKLPPKSKFKIIFHNQSGTSKTVYVGFRMLRNQEGGN